MRNQMERQRHQRFGRAKCMAAHDIALNNVPNQLTQQYRPLSWSGVKCCSKTAAHQIGVERAGSRLLRGELQELPKREGINLMGHVPARELGAQLTPEEARVRSGDTHSAARIEQRPHKPLPLGRLLHFVQINRSAGVIPVQYGLKRREVLRPKAIQTCIFKIQCDGTPVHGSPDLALLRAFPAPSDAGENQSVGGCAGFPVWLEAPGHLTPQRPRGD